MLKNSAVKSAISRARVLYCAKFLQSCPTLCDPVDSSLSGSSVHWILQAKILEGLCPPPGIFPTQGLNPGLLHLLQKGRFFITNDTWEALSGILPALKKKKEKKK